MKHAWTVEISTKGWSSMKALGINPGFRIASTTSIPRFSIEGHQDSAFPKNSMISIFPMSTSEYLMACFCS